jgi:hypothetical protein
MNTPRISTQHLLKEEEEEEEEEEGEEEGRNSWMND